MPLTKGSYDLYWIAVAPNTQGLGIGRRLMHLAERAIAKLGGGRLYIETSSRAAYVRTRRFYRAVGYRLAARLRDFYARGDHKVVFCKTIVPVHAAAPSEYLEPTRIRIERIALTCGF